MSSSATEVQCPFTHSSRGGTTNRDWWPNQLRLDLLHQHSAKSDPMGEDFNYAKEFKSLDLQALKKDLAALMTDSQDWWPADFGHYGPLFIRMAWHSAGTYRIGDGRGGGGRGQQRFAPLNSWPDNVSLDKARRLLWPIKQKYGRRISWADLMILTGNVALETMGFKTFGFGGGREDVWEPDQDVYWGEETSVAATATAALLAASTRSRESARRRADGPHLRQPGRPGRQSGSARRGQDIRETFGRMAMNDEETVALIAGGHTFGKTHGAGPARTSASSPKAPDLEAQGLGWESKFGTGHGRRHDHQRPGSHLDHHADEVEQQLLLEPVRLRVGADEEPGRCASVGPKDGAGAGTMPHAHDKSKKLAPTMLTTDLSLRVDPAYEKISRRFMENPDQFADAFARAWFKLTHRDMGPRARYLGPEVPEEELHLAGPDSGGQSPADRRHRTSPSLKASPRFGLYRLAARVHGVGFGIHLPRLRQARRREWRAHSARAAEGLGGQPAGAAGESAEDARGHPERLQQARSGRQEGLARGPDRARRLRRRRAGREECRSPVKVPFTPGRMDASQEQTDVESFAVLEPIADGFRNYQKASYAVPAEALLIDRAQLLTLTAPEMTVLIGGLRVLDANVGSSKHGVFTKRPEALTNDFFVNLLDMGTQWKATSDAKDVFEGRDRKTGAVKWTGTRVDLVFGSNSQLRALAEVYGSADAQEKFVGDFVAAWNKVMNLDRFDLA